MGKQGKQCQTLFFWDSKITADGDCSHEIKRRLLLGRKVMTNLVRQFSHSVLSDCLRPHESQHSTFLSITNSQSLLKLKSIKPVMPSNHLILCCPLLLLPSIFSSIRVFYNKSVLRISWRFSFSLSPSNQYSGLTSFRIDWVDLLIKHYSECFCEGVLDKINM